ncbi:3-deoxy-D-manno-octulosonic-acid transferase [Neisseria sp. HSC-16F19]|nr:lipid IV(A) 3-deoxy-D-manno-octulosonic acid transferase [Neisseria sp. HSC-16F19]MCP2040302.1 3-deoxy-D-manno-octulosonic-acid transferase [Neisseria sp. HSC-16F19]
MLKLIYNLLWRIAPPLLRRYLRRRARLAPAYLHHWDERFGRPHPAPLQEAIWIHAVSVGETRAAEPLIHALQQHFPGAPLLITQTTPTGRAAALSLYPQAQCRYLPYDRRDYIRRFLQEHRPRFGVFMETEIWPNTLTLCREYHIPLFLANARLSERSQQGYLKARTLIRPALQAFHACYAQSEADAERLRQIGMPHVQVSGNSKYDIEPPGAMAELAAAFRQRIGTRPVVLCASTRFYHGQDEAELLLRAWQAYHGDALLVIVPRHPERFQAAHDLARTLGFRVQKRSDEAAVAADTQVWIGDSMGELFAYFLSADIAFVGGSLVDCGCHNIIEPIACGRPTLFGPSTYNFAAATTGALAAGAALQVTDAADWQTQTAALLADPAQRQALSQHARDFIRQHQGASRRMADDIAAKIRAVSD